MNWQEATRQMPPEYHLKKVRRDDDGGWLAIAWHQGDDIKVGGETREEALANLVAVVRDEQREAVERLEEVVG